MTSIEDVSRPTAAAPVRNWVRNSAMCLGLTVQSILIPGAIRPSSPSDVPRSRLKLPRPTSGAGRCCERAYDS